MDKDIKLAKLDALKIPDADRLKNAFQLERAILYVNQDALLMINAAKEELVDQQEVDIQPVFDSMIEKNIKILVNIYLFSSFYLSTNYWYEIFGHLSIQSFYLVE